MSSFSPVAGILLVESAQAVDPTSAYTPPSFSPVAGILLVESGLGIGQTF